MLLLCSHLQFSGAFHEVSKPGTRTSYDVMAELGKTDTAVAAFVGAGAYNVFLSCPYLALLYCVPGTCHVDLRYVAV